MRNRFASALLGAAGLAAAAAQAGEAPLASQLDYSLDASRDIEISCKAGDVERFSGKTMGQVFGDRWPTQPEPQGDDAHRPAKMTSIAIAEPPRGFGSQYGIVIFAVLVDASGTALRAEPICMSSEIFERNAARALRRARYAPAVINGEPVTSVAIARVAFNGREYDRRSGR